MKIPMWRRYLQFWGRNLPADLDTEFQFHLEMRTQELIDQGLAPDAARAQARKHFGDVEDFRRECRTVDDRMERSERRRGFLNRASQDFTFSFRQIRRNPVFTIVTVLILALGIGANAAIFGVVNSVLLNPLPFTDPDRIVALWEAVPERFRVAPANYVDWREQNAVFEEVAMFRAGSANLTGDGEPEQLRGSVVTPGYFRILGVQALLGRWFTEADLENDGEPVVLLDEGLWRRRFAADPSIIGRTIRLTDQLHTIIGVMPDGLYPSWPTTSAAIEFGDDFHQFWRGVVPNPDFLTNRRSHVVGVIAKMKPDVGLDEAQANMDNLAASLAEAYPANNEGEGILVSVLANEILGDVRSALWILQCSVGLLLLIACANVASLTLARLSARRREIAVRMALGAGRLRLVRQFLAEGLVLASLGGLGGLLAAAAGIGLLKRFAPPDIPRMEMAGIDSTTLVFIAVLCGLTCIVFALFPALQASRSDPGDTLKEAGRSTSVSTRQTFRRALVAMQLAVSVILTISSVLLIQTFINLRQVETGVNPEGLLLAEISLAQGSYPGPAEISGFMDELLERTADLPGVVSTSASYDHPLQGTWIDTFSIESQPLGPDDDRPGGYFKIVSPGYFETSGTPLVAGRTFNRFDRADSGGVAIVNEALVRSYFPNGNALGEVLHIPTPQGMLGTAVPAVFEIVGVVGNTRFLGIDADPAPAFYVPFAQSPMGSFSILIRTTVAPSSVAPEFRSVLWSIDAGQPIGETRTMDAIVDSQVARPRFNMLLMALFGFVALVMSAVGVYGLLAYLVSQRTNEIGIRVALGASGADVFRLVIGQALVLTLAGIGAGIAGALAVTQVMDGLLFGVSPRDPLVFALVPALLIVVVLAACYPAAHRAMRVDPAQTIRGQ